MLLLNRLIKKIIIFLICFALLYTVLITKSYSQDLLRAEVEVIWEGGPDLVVPVFIPPMVISEPGNIIYVSFRNANNGNLPSKETITKIYISTNAVVDPTVDRSLGEARIPVLNIDELSDEIRLQFTVPNDFPPGRYYLAACADADNKVYEVNENNNCSFSKIDNFVSFGAANIKIQNKAPVCELAFPSISKLWPANHKLIDVVVNGVTDPDNDPIQIAIQSISQDEPVSGLGDGDTSPDGFGLGLTTAKVRAERSGLGNGRIYVINFIASDNKDANCSGTITVGVPHDKSSRDIIDDGLRFDSTKL